MALQLIIGKAGSGKSYDMYNIMIDQSEKYKNENYVAVVPEQYSMETQKEIMTLHKKHGSFNIEVTSFVRMAYSIFEEQGFNDFQVMDDLGKTLVMRKILEDCKKDLVLYGSKASMPGFTEKMKTVISELKQYGITESILEEMEHASEERPILKQKIKDISTINDAFNNYINEKMITSEDVLNILCDNIPQSDWAKNTSFYFDGYTGFTPAQYNVLELLISYGKDVTVAITLPEEEINNLENDGYELFSLSKETILKLRALAENNGIRENPVIISGAGDKPYRIKNNPVLCHIENNIFRNRKIDKYNENNAVEIYSASNPRKESEYVASRISQLIKNENYRYNEIAVITADMNTYYRFLEEEFSKFGVPAFIDYKRDILSNPYVDGIVAALEMIEKDFSYDTVFRFIKLGMTKLENSYIDIFENYVIRTGRRGYKSYCQKWEKLFRNMPEEHLEIVNKSREHLINTIEPLRNAIKGKEKTIGVYTKAVYQFLLDLEVQKQLEEYAQYFEGLNMPGKAKEYSQAFGSIIGLLDQLVVLMNDEKISIKEYKQLVQSGFENIKIGIIPPGLDMVMVGDLERTRLKDTKKIIFFMGVNDGVIPKTTGGNGVITDLDREFLDKHNFILAPTAKDNVFKQRLYLYSLLAKPTEKIIFTFSNGANDGSILRKSYLIGEVMSLFTDLEIIDLDKTKLELKDITNINQVANLVAKDFAREIVEKKDKDIETKKNQLSDVLTATLLQDENSKKIVDLIMKGAFYETKTPVLEKVNAIRLYQHPEYIKTTALERYAKCPYSHFLTNGLGLRERPEHKIEEYDIGNLYHEAIDAFFKEVQQNNLNWETISDNESHSILDNCIEKVMEEYENDALQSSSRNKFLKKQVKATAEKTVDVLINHIRAGKFRPAEYELVLNCGRVDRVDVAEYDNKIYVKVIDYKSGKTNFSLSDTYNGLSLQLMLYLKESIEYEKKKYPDKQVLPAGGFYFYIKNPYINNEDIDKTMEKYLKNSDIDVQEVKDKVIKQLNDIEYKLSGLTTDDREVMALMDKDIRDSDKPSVILPVTKRSATSFYNSNSYIDSNVYEKLLEHVSNVADTMRNEVMEGNIPIRPTQGRCMNCKYHDVCGFDVRLGYEYRKVETVSKDTIIETLMGEDNDNVDR